MVHLCTFFLNTSFFIFLESPKRHKVLKSEGDPMCAGGHGSMDRKEKSSRNGSWWPRAGGDYPGKTHTGASWGSWTWEGGVRCAIKELQGWRSLILAERRCFSSMVCRVSMCSWEETGKEESCNNRLGCADWWRKSEDLQLERWGWGWDGRSGKHSTLQIKNHWGYLMGIYILTAL